MSFVNNLNTINSIKHNIKNAIETKGQIVTNFASYPASIENIVSGGVYQYDSLENMYADISNAHTDDLAVVYASTQAPITATTEFQVATFPQTVVLDEALSDYVEVGFQAVDESVMFDCWGQLDSSRFSMQCYTDDGDIRIQYESQDGITYTRTRFMKNREDISGNEMDFGLVIKFGSRWGDFEWNNAIGKFIISGSTVFDGVFQYNGTNFNLLLNTGLNVNPEAVWDDKFYGANGIQNGTLNKVTNLNLTELRNRVNLYSNISNLKLDNSINDLNNFYYNSKIKYLPIINMYYVTNLTHIFYECNNLSDKSLDNIANSLPLANNITNLLVYNTGIMPDRFSYNAKSVLYDKGYLDCDQNTSNWSTQYNIYDGNTWVLYNRGENFDRYGTTLMSILHQNFTNATSITVKSDNNDYGILLSGENVFSQARDKFYNVSSINIEINTSNLVSTQNMFRLGNSKLAYISNFDTSNVIDMSGMFEDCTKLINTSNYNTTKVTNMYSMFSGCYGLSAIPNLDTSNVTNMSYMFAHCWKITSIPNLDTSKVTDMGGIFSDCTNLTSIPNLDTSNVKVMGYMFNNCTNLTSIPNLDTSNVTSTYSMFCRCDKLTEIKNLYLPNAREVSQMFFQCGNITTIQNINAFNASEANWFCSSLSNVRLIEDINLSNVVNAYYAFNSLSKLTTIRNVNLSNADKIEGLFTGCYSLSTISNIDVSNAKSFYHIFNGCTNLVNAPYLDTSNSTSLGGMFYNCTNLVNVPEYNTAKATMEATFAHCNNLSDASIQNIINMCLNSNSPSGTKSLKPNYDWGPFAQTNIVNTCYQNRWAELDAAGWSH